MHWQKIFFGDGSCGEDNLRKSCFAAEWCMRYDRFHSRRQYVRNLRERKDSELFVAEDENGEVMGGVRIDTTSKNITHMCVDDSARGSGVGRALLNHALETLKSSAFLTVAVPTPTGMAAAARVLNERAPKLLDWYSHNGFTLDATEPVDGYLSMSRRSPTHYHWKSERRSALLPGVRE